MSGIIKQLSEMTPVAIHTFFEKDLLSLLGIQDYESEIDLHAVDKRLHLLKLASPRYATREKNLLFFAIQVGHFDAIRLLIKLGFDKYISHASPPLHLAAYHGRMEIFQFLLEQGLDKNKKDYEDGAGILHYAARGGNTELMRFLIDEVGCDVHEENRYGHSLLMEASFSGNCELIKLLIEHYGVNPRVHEGARSLQYWIQYKKRYHHFSDEVIKLCTNTDSLNQLYGNYLARFIKSMIPYDIAQDANSIIALYAAPVSEEEVKVVNTSFDELSEESRLILKPLIDFCKDEANEEARVVLKHFLAKKLLDPMDMERELDKLLNDPQHLGKPYLYPVFLCRCETAKRTKNSPQLSEPLIPLQHQKNEDDLLALQQAHAALIQRYRILGASYNEINSCSLKYSYIYSIGNCLAVLASGISLLCIATAATVGIVFPAVVLIVSGALGLVSGFIPGWPSQDDNSINPLTESYAFMLAASVVVLGIGIAFLSVATLGIGGIAIGAALTTYGTIGTSLGIHGLFKCNSMVDANEISPTPENTI